MSYGEYLCRVTAVSLLEISLAFSGFSGSGSLKSEVSVSQNDAAIICCLCFKMRRLTFVVSHYKFYLGFLFPCLVSLHLYGWLLYSMGNIFLTRMTWSRRIYSSEIVKLRRGKTLVSWKWFLDTDNQRSGRWQLTGSLPLILCNRLGSEFYCFIMLPMVSGEKGWNSLLNLLI